MARHPVTVEDYGQIAHEEVIWVGAIQPFLYRNQDLLLEGKSREESILKP